MKVKLVFGLVVFIIFCIVFYESRRVPEPGKIKEVTVLPLEVKNVLGVKTPEISIRVPIFLYHYVEYVQDKDDTIRKSLNITPYALKSQIETLKNAGYTFITPSDITDALNKKKNFPRKLLP